MRALSLMPPGSGVLTTELKINLLAQAIGDLIPARGKVVKGGRTFECSLKHVFANSADQPRLIAFLTATLMIVEGRENIVGQGV